MHAKVPLLSLKAVDLMTETVVMIPEESSLKSAAHLMAEFHISGVPVVDKDGRCKGVLSSTDFIHLMEDGPSAKSRQECCFTAHSAWQMLETSNLPADTVRQYMTPDPVMVRPSSTICELAKMMVDAHIHRVIVVDKNERPIGIVSSTDVLAAIAHAGNSYQS